MRRHKLYDFERKVIFATHSKLFNNEIFSLTSLKQQLGFQGRVNTNF
jgi:hypothetical protein